MFGEVKGGPDAAGGAARSRAARVPGQGTVLVARMDNIGDVVLAEPTVRAVAAGARRLVLLAGPRGSAAADLLPGVDAVIEWCAPWIDPEPPPVRSGDVFTLVERVRSEAPDAALILTSFHQSPLPLALLLRMAGVPWIGAISEDYPGSLLDLRHRAEDGVHESTRALSLAEAAGFRLPQGDDPAPALRPDLPGVDALTGGPGYVAVHPGASAPARAVPPDLAAAAIARLRGEGRRVVLTGTAGDVGACAAIAAAADEIGQSGGPGGGPAVTDLAGRTRLDELAAVLRGADAAVTGNTGPAHLAAAVRTPVVSLFAPVVPSAAWAPRGPAVRVLGDQEAPCRDTRARTCPVEGHPCVSRVTPADIADAVRGIERGTAAEPVGPRRTEDV